MSSSFNFSSVVCLQLQLIRGAWQCCRMTNQKLLVVDQTLTAFTSGLNGNLETRQNCWWLRKTLIILSTRRVKTKYFTKDRQRTENRANKIFCLSFTFCLWASTIEIFSSCQSNAAVVVLGLFKDFESTEAEVFIEYADDNLILSFGITKSEEISQLLRNESIFNDKPFNANSSSVRN